MTTVEVLPDAASEEAGLQARKSAKPVFTKENPGEAFGKSKKAKASPVDKS
jgi:hypothetical protein